MSDSSDSQPNDLGMTTISRVECEALLERTLIGRIVYVADNHPIALPVNYRWHEGSVVFRTLAGQKLNAAVADRPISFEIDGWDADRHTGWSVLIKGHGREVSEWAEQEQLEQLGLVPWANGDWKVRWIRIEASAIEGRSLL